jgi:hypothetical protein
MQNLHFLPDKLDKPIFHKNLDVFSSTFLYIHVGNMLFVDNTPYKNMFNNVYSANFFKSFDDLSGEDQYLLRSIFLNFKNLHSFGYNVPTLVEHNPFGRIRCINPNNP